ncbi:MAG TPA: ABC transporter permease [Candidatus Angelobacter sp.]|jgi:putative ABC transport system permease protein
MGTLFQDVRYGLRMLRRNPGFTAVAVLTLALGIGANSAIFTVVNAVLLQPLPYPEPDRLVYLNEGNRGSSIGYPNFVDWRAQNQAFERMAATQSASFVLTGHGEAELIPSSYISEGFFQTLGVKPALGRDFLPAEDKPAATPVAIVSHKFWQQHLGGEQNVIGTNLRLDDGSYTVVGVMPANFKFLFEDDPQIFVPIGLTANTPEKLDRAKHGGVYAIARLKPGVTLAQAQSDLNLISARLAKAYPDIDYLQQGQATSLSEETIGGEREWILILVSAVALVLLIACANVANLLLAKASARQSEMAIRLSLGASRTRLFRQMLTESILLGLGGGILGLLVASGGVRALLWVAREDFIRTEQIHLNPTVVVFTFLVSMLTGVGFGLIPALHISRFRGALQTEAHKAISSGRQRVKNVLVVVELALSLVLLVGAGLLVRSFITLTRVETGFQNHGLLTAGIHLSLNKYKTQPELDAFFDTLVEKLNGVPGVESAAVTMPLEFSGVNWGYGFLVDGDPYPAPGEINYTRLHYISPDYLSTMKIPLVQGRNFIRSDNDASEPVALVSRSFVHVWLHDQDPIGKRVRLGKARDLANPENPWFTIVGVVNDVRHYGEEWIQGELLVPFNQHQRYHVPITQRYLVIRSKGNTALAAQQLRSVMAKMDKNQPITSMTTMDQLISQSMIADRSLMFLITTFAVLALVLAAIGIYGVLSYWVNQRTREIGIRLALGADQKNILSVVLREGMKLIVIGLIIGVPLALGLTNLLPNVLYGVGRHDPITFIVIALLLGAVAALACYIPARRAAKVDPMVALRYE